MLRSRFELETQIGTMSTEVIAGSSTRRRRKLTKDGFIYYHSGRRGRDERLEDHMARNGFDGEVAVVKHLSGESALYRVPDTHARRLYEFDDTITDKCVVPLFMAVGEKYVQFWTSFPSLDYNDWEPVKRKRKRRGGKK